MKLAFESNLQYQHDPIKLIPALFEGHPLENSDYSMNANEKGEQSFIWH
nr:hypothetical protein [Bacteroidota bacterium]